MGRLASVTVAVVLAVLMMLSAVPFVAPGAAAEGESIATYVWDGEGTTALASEAANWYQDIGGVITNDIAPTNNSNIRYDATSVKSCTYDLAYPLFVAYSLTLATGYTGTVTQGDVDIGIGAGGYLQQDGTMTGSSVKSIYCAGPFIYVAGSCREYKLVMMGEGHDLRVQGNTYIRSIRISGDTVYSYVGSTLPSIRSLTVDDGARLSIAAGHVFNLHYGSDSAPSYWNYGSIGGDGELRFYMRGADGEYSMGVVECPVNIVTAINAGASRKFTMTGPVTLSSSLTISSQHSTNTITLDLNGHSLTAASVTVGTRGNILWGEGTHLIGSLDTSAGGSDFESSKIIMEQSGTVKLGAGQSIPSLEIAASTIAPSWTFGSAGAWAWNVTGLDPGYAYNYHVDGELLDVLTANASGVIALMAETTEKTTFELLRVPIISPVPLHPGHHTRHNVDEGITYSVRYTCDQPVTWSISGAPFLSIDQNGVISGMPGILDSGEYLVTVTAANANGADVVTFELTVEDSLQPVTNAVTNEVNGVVPIVIGLVVLSSVVTLLGGLYNRMKF